MTGGPRTRRRRRTALGAIVLGAALAVLVWLLVDGSEAPVPSPDADRAGSEPAFGFGDSSAVYPYPGSPRPGELARLEARAGAQIGRFPIRWETVEPLPPNPGPEYEWGRFDRFAQALAERGIRPMPVLLGAPGWARDAGCTEGICPPAVDRLEEWSRFVAAAARRYPEAAGLEIWNEPNHLGFWQTMDGPDPGRYATLFQRAVDAVRSVDPGLTVVTGSVGYTPEGDQPRGDLSINTFLGGFYAALDERTLESSLALGFHAYPGLRELGGLLPDGQFLTTLKQVVAARDAEDPDTPLWLTEFGTSTSAQGPLGTPSEADQASAIEAVLRALRGERGIEVALLYTVVDRPPTAAVAEEGYGIVERGSFEPKLAYCRLVAAGEAPLPPGCPERAGG